MRHRVICHMHKWEGGLGTACPDCFSMSQGRGLSLDQARDRCDKCQRYPHSCECPKAPAPTHDPKAQAAPESTYADGNPKSVQGAKKYDLMYLPLPARIAVNQALEDGAKKYGKANWRETGVSASVYLNAAARHMDQYNEGQELASDSLVHNLGHAMACLAIIIDAAANGKLIDDRPFPCVDTDALLLRIKHEQN